MPYPLAGHRPVIIALIMEVSRFGEA